MAHKLKDIELLQIIYDLQYKTDQEFASIEDIAQQVEHTDRTYSFRLMYALEMLGVVEESPERV